MTTTLHDLHQYSLNISQPDNGYAEDNDYFVPLLASSIAHIDFNQFCLDSRHVGENDAFVLLASQSGDVAKSADYVVHVIEKVAFIISEIDLNTLAQANDAITELVAKHADKIIHLADIRQYLGSLIQTRLSAQGSSALPEVLAITGTNGKTTISQLTAQLLQGIGKVSAVMGTAGNGILGQLEQATHTTGDVLAVQSFIQKMASDKVQTLSLEASSHGLEQLRMQGVPVQVAIYTNLSRDHLDYHNTMEEYAHAKARLFDRAVFPTLTHAIINLDDEYAQVMIDTAKQSNVTIWTYTLDADKPATFVAKNISPSLTGVDIDMQTDFGTIRLHSPLLGLFNVANLLATVAGTLALAGQWGVTLADMPQLVEKLQGADGRMDTVASSQGCFIVDYAHTPDALVQVLTSLKSHCEGNLWAVFGCGGDRDKGKRPLMAQAGLNYADKVVLTADNPRSEHVTDILQDMQAGMTADQHDKTYIEADRRQAIKYAVDNAGDNDIVVVAGKGHETYQEINGVRYDFDDREVLQSYLQ